MTAVFVLHTRAGGKECEVVLQEANPLLSDVAGALSAATGWDPSTLKLLRVKGKALLLSGSMLSQTASSAGVAAGWDELMHGCCPCFLSLASPLCLTSLACLLVLSKCSIQIQPSFFAETLSQNQMHPFTPAPS